MNKLPLPKSYFKKLTSLSTENLVARLAATDVGMQIMKKGEAEAKKIISNLSQRYDEFGDAASDFFKRRAQYYSLLAGLFVAFVMNVDALALFEAYLDNPEMRAAVVAKSELISSSYEQASKQLEDLKKKAEADGATDGAATLDVIKQDVNAIRIQVEDLKGAGVPIGYSLNVAPATIWTTDSGNSAYWRLFLSIPWFLRVFVSGLLVGLGGAFWFNVVTNLMKATRGGGAGGGPSDAGKRSPQTPKDPVKRNQDIFMAVATGKMPLASSSSSGSG